MKINEIAKLKNVMPKIIMLNFSSTKKSYEAYQLWQDYKENMDFIINELEKIKKGIEGAKYEKDGRFSIPNEKKEELEQKIHDFFQEDLDLLKGEVNLTLEDVLEAGQAGDDRYKINAEDFEMLEILFKEIRKYENGKRRKQKR